MRRLGTLRSYGRDISALFSTSIVGPSLTQQQFKEECDINTIVKRFGLTGEMPVSQRQPLPDSAVYGEVSFQEMLNAVSAAQRSFMDLPASTRARFANDPAKLLKFVEDPSNRDDAISWGMIPKPVEPATPSAPAA